MPHLIVGPVTHESARLWVRGGWWRRRARVSVRPAGERQGHELRLVRSSDFTATAEIAGLEAATAYDVEARFEAPGGWRTTCVSGRFRTFPAPDSGAAFSFLHASCNLSVVSLTQAFSVAAVAIGSLAAFHMLRRPRGAGARVAASGAPGSLATADPVAAGGGPSTARARRAGAGSAVVRFFQSVYAHTASWQPAPIVPSPFAPLCDLLGGAAPPAFMIHAGDQIYFDFPLAAREPTRDAYRRAYRQAFFGDPVQREFLASLPHFMTLDDHELVDGFARDFVPIENRVPEDYYRPALGAYDEYVASRQTPDAGEGHRGYAFDHGAARFLVLDLRTQRFRESRRMLDRDQLDWLLGWLEKSRDRIKFVVSSVPFLAELRDRADLAGERDDKWTGRFYRDQRDEILDFVHAQRIGGLVFLAGDMHCTYHATMQLGAPGRRVLVHELAGGPIHQAQYTPRADFCDEVIGRTRGAGVAYRTFLRAFSDSAAGVLRVSVSPQERPAVRWRVVPTGAGLAGSARAPALTGRIDLEAP